MISNSVLAIQKELSPGISIWCPPTGRPYWVLTGKSNAGPDLTDEEMVQFGLLQDKDRKKMEDFLVELI